MNNPLARWLKHMPFTKAEWITAQGQRVRVRDMSDRHLVNTIRHLERNVYFADAFDDGKGNTLDPFDDYEPEPPSRVYRAMLYEAKRRGIDVANSNPRVATRDEFP